MDAKKIDEILSRGVANVIPSREELKKVLLSGKRLNIYLGIDPTATQIHLGHAVPLRKLQAFVALGHNVTFLIGDFTALIGDTSDKDRERPILTKEQIQENFKTYKAQAEKIVDFSKVRIRYNSEWLSRLGYEDVIQIFRHFSLNDFLGRELIKKRLESGGHVRFDEMAYPAMQGYDSYFMDTDVQIGGTDQTFNMQAGRTLQKDRRGKETFVLSTAFLEGTDGRKMSKSWGNAIWLDDQPNEMFGKVMSLKDELIISYFTLATSIPLEKAKEVETRLSSGENPMILKKELAYQIVKELHRAAAAIKAQESFEKVFQKREIPVEIASYHPKKPTDTGLLSILTGAQVVSSRAEAKRLIQQGAVEINHRVVRDPQFTLSGDKEQIIKIGKTRYLKVLKVLRKPAAL